MILELAVVIFSLILIAISVCTYLRFSIRRCRSNSCMKNKVVIVTGANAGIGFHTAKELARRGARVVLACRDAGRAGAALASIVAETGNNDVVFQHLDLSCLESVQRFAADIIEREDRLDVLINNAGMYGFADSHTENGIIQPMQVNYFGHYLLTMLLLPLLKKSQPSRIVNLSSIMHYFGRFNPNTINESGYFCNNFSAYCNSKFCMLMFTIELSRRLRDSGVVTNAVHPGVILTGISKNASPVLRFLFWCWTLAYKRTAEEGAQTVIQLAVAQECEKDSGKYFVDCSSRCFLWKAASMSKARELWDYSAKLVGIEQQAIDC